MAYLTHLIALLTISLLPSYETRRASVVGEFVGSTPCDAEPRRFLGITSAAACERITWRLALSADERRSTFKLHVVYGMQARNAPGFEGGGTTADLNGTWVTVTGTDVDRAALVYRLMAGNPQRSLGLAGVSDHLLHLLNHRGSLMVGNGGWSYTLNRKDVTRSRSAPVNFEPVSSAFPAMAGVFEGRSPCHELATQLAIRPGSDCTKLKWALTLHQDPVTRAPTRYVLEGTAYRTAPRTGRWAVLRSRSDPKLVVYRLDPDQPGRSLSFFRADDNILLFLNEDGAFLVGDSHFSYTLNRVTRQPKSRQAARRAPPRHGQAYTP